MGRPNIDECYVNGCKNIIRSRNMCDKCGTYWRRAGRPDPGFDIRNDREKFDELCQDGTIKEKLTAGANQTILAAEYQLNIKTVASYLRKHNLIGPPKQIKSQTTCTIPGCNYAHRAKDLCGYHYNRLLKYGDPLATPIQTDKMNEENLSAEVLELTSAVEAGVVDKLLVNYSVVAIAEYYGLSTERCYKILKDLGVSYQQYGRRTTGHVTINAVMDAGGSSAKFLAMHKPWVKQIDDSRILATTFGCVPR